MISWKCALTGCEWNDFRVRECPSTRRHWKVQAMKRWIACSYDFITFIAFISQGQKRYPKELLRQWSIFPNFRVNFLARCASKPLFCWVVPSNCSENSLVLFMRFFGFGVPFWPMNFIPSMAFVPKHIAERPPFDLTPPSKLAIAKTITSFAADFAETSLHSRLWGRLGLLGLTWNPITDLEICKTGWCKTGLSEQGYGSYMVFAWCTLRLMRSSSLMCWLNIQCCRWQSWLLHVLWYVVGMNLVCPMSQFPQAPFTRAPFGECRLTLETQLLQ